METPREIVAQAIYDKDLHKRPTEAEIAERLRILNSILYRTDITTAQIRGATRHELYEKTLAIVMSERIKTDMREIFAKQKNPDKEKITELKTEFDELAKLYPNSVIPLEADLLAEIGSLEIDETDETDYKLAA